MKKQGKGNKSWWIWLLIVIVIALILVIGFTLLKSPINPVIVNNTLPPVENPVETNQTVETNNTPAINNTTKPTNPVVQETGINATLNKSIRLTIKAANPQYRGGQDVKIIYTIENFGNQSVSISKDFVNGFVIKNSIGEIAQYKGNATEVKVLNSTFDIAPGQKISSMFVIGGKDYNLMTNGNRNDGFYNFIYIYIGDAVSNKITLRVIP